MMIWPGLSALPCSLDGGRRLVVVVIVAITVCNIVIHSGRLIDHQSTNKIIMNEKSSQRYDLIGWLGYTIREQGAG